MSSVDFLADLGPSADARALARVLSAATAPPWPHELRGYEAARRAFEKAGTAGAGAAGTAGTAGTTPVRRGAGVPLRRLIGVKLAAVAGALTVTGVAVAAEADVLPSPIQRAAHQVLGGVGVPEPDAEPRAGQTMASSPGSSHGQPGSKVSQSPNRASGDPSSSGGLLPGTPSGTSDGSAPSTSAPAPAADVVALCRTYVAHQEDGNGNGNSGLSEHDRRKLATLAGGADKIAGFCAQVLAASSGSPIPQPTGAPTTPAASTPGTPSPSHDHKPNSSSPSSSGTFAPASTSSPEGNGHDHTPNPSRIKR
ncbi:hypothetical protein ABH926_006532 [Catenulispora sp. GP43]|uniref:hypothetical protein n=1 Tax=Catenulispora sp. GP43 TaxID=3156263 RepID=UPI003518C261